MSGNGSDISLLQQFAEGGRQALSEIDGCDLQVFPECKSEQVTSSPNDRGMIDDFRLWGSRRWSRGGVRLTNVGSDTWAGHEFNYQNASLSEGGVLAVVVESFSETPHWKRDSTDFLRLL